MTVILNIGFVILALGMLLCLVRCVRGPSAFDRILAFDCLVLQVIGIILLFCIKEQSAHYMDVVLIVGLLGFLGTISFAAFLGEGKHHAS